MYLAYFNPKSLKTHKFDTNPLMLFKTRLIFHQPETFRNYTFLQNKISSLSFLRFFPVLANQEEI